VCLLTLGCFNAPDATATSLTTARNRSTAKIIKSSLVRRDGRTIHEVVSPNWAGWAVASRRPITAVKASWRVPKVSCARREDSIASPWVGIDGWYTWSKTVEQIGIDVGCNKGDPFYRPWVELWPSPLKPFSKKLPIEPGDRLTGLVYRVGRYWTFRLTNNTSRDKQAFHALCGYSRCLSSSAEAITERVGHLPVTNFGRSYFTNAVAATDQDAAYLGSRHWRTAWQSTIENRGGDVLVQPSDFYNGGSSFYTEWEQAN
jgi:hypothetical protein